MKKKHTLGKVIAGVAVGAAAGAAAVALSDKKNRKKLEVVAKDLNTRAQKLVSEIRSDKNVKELEKGAKPALSKARRQARAAL